MNAIIGTINLKPLCHGQCLNFKHERHWRVNHFSVQVGVTHSPWRLRQNLLPKHHRQPTIPQSIKTYKTVSWFCTICLHLDGFTMDCSWGCRADKARPLDCGILCNSLAASNLTLIYDVFVTPDKKLGSVKSHAISGLVDLFWIINESTQNWLFSLSPESTFIAMC